MTRLKSVLFAALLPACAVGPSASTVQSDLDSCGSLCSANDQLQVPFDQLVSYQQHEAQALVFDAAAGTAQVDLDLWANAGGLEAVEPEGVAVTIGSQPQCLSEIRYWYNDDGCETHCVVTVATVAGTNTVPIDLYQWNGTDGWKVNVESVTITLQ